MIFDEWRYIINFVRFFESGLDYRFYYDIGCGIILIDKEFL
jgi:hypothetical protein